MNKEIVSVELQLIMTVPMIRESLYFDEKSGYYKLSAPPQVNSTVVLRYNRDELRDLPIDAGIWTLLTADEIKAISTRFAGLIQPYIETENLRMDIIL